MNIFLHVGYPKCFSTTLQRNYFSRHPDIFYGGIGINSNIDFHNKNLNLLFESGIIYFNTSLFNREFDSFKQTIDSFIEEGLKKGKDVFGFSSEHLVFNFSPQGTDYQEKLNRIFRLFGTDVKIIMILRGHISLITSLYKEFVRMGCPYYFTEFIEWLYKYQDRNFYHELFYDDVIHNIHSYIPESSLFIRWYEDFKDEKSADLNLLFEQISAFLHISRKKLDISDQYPSLKEEEVSRKVAVNKEIRYDFGDIHLEGIENHRRQIYFNDFLGLNYSEEQLFANVIKKRESLKRTSAESSIPAERATESGLFSKMIKELESRCTRSVKRYRRNS